MPSLQVRNLPEPIYRELVRQAEKERRSLAQQAIEVLARGLRAEVDPRMRRREALRRASLIDPAQTRHLPDPVRLIREDRNR